MSPVLRTYATSKNGTIVLPPVESIPLNVTAIGNENTLGESIPSNDPDIPPGTHERSGAEMSFQPECRRAARRRHSSRRFPAPAVRQTALPLRVDAQRGAKLTTGSAQAYGRSIPSRRRTGPAEAQVDAEASRQRTSRLHPPGAVTRGTNRPASSPLP